MLAGMLAGTRLVLGRPCLPNQGLTPRRITDHIARGRLSIRLSIGLRIFATLACICGFSPSPSFAQSEPQSPAASVGAKVALVDVGDVFRRLDRFRQRLGQLKADVDTFERELKKEEQQLEKEAARLKRYKRPAARDAAEQALAKSQGELRLRRELKQQMITQEEAKMYYAAWLDLRREISMICQEHGIDVVLRYDRTPVNPHDRESILARCNSTIVYQQHLDLTDLLVTRLNARNHWAARPYGAPTIRGQLGKQSKWLVTIPAIAAQQVITARTAWAVDRMVFPPGS